MFRKLRGSSTPQDLLLPEGKLIRTTRGGASALKQLLLDLKKYSFSGYVRIVLTRDGVRSEGIILLRAGNPEASLHLRGEEQERGRTALKRVWQDSYIDEATIELHARIDMDDLVTEYADAILERPAKVVKKPKVPQVVDRAEIDAKLAEWKAAGFAVSSVEAELSSNPGVLTGAYLTLLEAIRKAEAVEETLKGLDTTGFETRAAALRQKLKDPLHNPDIDSEVESLRDAIESYKRIEERRKIEVTRERDSQERTKKVLELVLRQRSALRPETPPPSREEVAKALEGPLPTRDQDTELIDQYTFDAFVVGESNRFAYGAAVTAAKQPGNAYNPLVVTSGPGLGKTHLLHAVGNYLRGHRPESKILYLTGETFAAHLETSRTAGGPGAMQERIRGLDCLLMDDLQFLSGKQELQEEVMKAFDELSGGGKQMVFASDRPPKSIAQLDERLVSRFESGLVANIQAPDLETRIQILRQRAQDAHLSVDSAVLTYIANLVEDNVRELGGALNRVVAFSSLMGRPITADLAKEVLHTGAAEPASEPKAAPKASFAPALAASVPTELRSGRSYLIEEDRPEHAYRLFLKAAEGGKNGLLITRTNPKRVREIIALDSVRVLWLTDREGSKEETIAPALERIVYEIEGFMAKRPQGSVMLDGVEYLVSNNSFDAVLKFVRRLVDTVSEGRHILLISRGPATGKEQELRMLEREMEVVRPA
ncbi:MAG TPA: DnaA/Hda family protein [Thermoplasmata archaeon]|nr:DnaA/Hda family protein [Thermoplasmata archaeon]